MSEERDADRPEPDEASPVARSPVRPGGADRRFFADGAPGRLAEQGSLLDDEGEDLRQYTGEPVETDDGWVVPQQQNVGPGNQAGGADTGAEGAGTGG